MTDIDDFPASVVTADAPVHHPAVEGSLVSVAPVGPKVDPSTQAEVDALDELWEHDWDVEEERAFAPQCIVVPELPQQSVWGQRMRRVLDVAVAATAFILAAPIMLGLAAAVKLSSAGPVIFTQSRIGAGGKEFRMWKFRSMTDGTDRQVLGDDEDRRRYIQNGFKLDGNDPRITPVGRFMRKTSLDELPQLLNVLRGEMSVVGIRPLVAPEIAMRPVRDQMLIKMMRPGLTGLWQVEGRSSIEDEARFDLDRRYVEQWSVWSDCSILLRTPMALLRTGDSR